MKGILVSFLLCLSVNEVEGQAFLNERDYLNSPEISAEAKLFFENKASFYDNDTLSRVLDSLFTKNDFTRPFYILVVSKMIRKADGAGAEMVWPSCEDLFEKKPDALIEFLYTDNRLTRQFTQDWAFAVVGGTGLSKTENEKQYVDKIKPLVLKRTKQKNRANLEDFYSRIYKECN